MCLDSFMMTPMPALAEMCTKLICSISSIIHDGALREWAPHCEGVGQTAGDPADGLIVSPLSSVFQRASATLRVPSAGSATGWAVSVAANPT